MIVRWSWKERFQFSASSDQYRYVPICIAWNGHRLRNMGLGSSRRGRPTAMSSITHEICGQTRAVCWGRKQRRAVREDSCSLLQASSGGLRRPVWVRLDLRQRGSREQVLWLTQLELGLHSVSTDVEGLRLACRLQVENADVDVWTWELDCTQSCDKNFISIRLWLEVRRCDLWDCELPLTWPRRQESPIRLRKFSRMRIY